MELEYVIKWHSRLCKEHLFINRTQMKMKAGDVDSGVCWKGDSWGVIGKEEYHERKYQGSGSEDKAVRKR